MVLDIVNFPFVIQFSRSFKDNFDIYFLEEYINGMELFDVIRDIGKKFFKICFILLSEGLLNTYDSQFYVASMILTLEYLHLQNIIYRDVKPENFMVDAQVSIQNKY